jgi:hypothetical protein
MIKNNTDQSWAGTRVSRASWSASVCRTRLRRRERNQLQHRLRGREQQQPGDDVRQRGLEVRGAYQLISSSATAEPMITTNPKKLRICSSISPAG